MQKSNFKTGILYTLFAYILWGIFPLYWKLLSAINPLHILAFRIILSLILTGGILTILKNFSWLKFFSNRKEGLLMVVAALTITANWGLYIWAVNNGHTIEAALGYYINPLISVMFGLVVFKEKLNVLQIIAFSLAVIGVLVLTILSGTPPWISLFLACSFGIYGLVKKTIRFSALESLGIETLIALPVSIILLVGSFGITGNVSSSYNEASSVYTAASGTYSEAYSSYITVSNTPGLSYLAELPVSTWLILVFCGLVTTLPLFLFAKGVKLLPLSTVGFMQFLAPTLTFLTGVFVFKESFSSANLITFVIIWTAVVIYIVSLKKK